MTEDNNSKETCEPTNECDQDLHALGPISPEAIKCLHENHMEFLLTLSGPIPPEVAKRLQTDHMKFLGIEDTMRLAQANNRFLFGKQEEMRRRLYREEFDTLLMENGGPAYPLEIKDGWAIDRSGKLPHLDRVLEESDRIFAQRAGIGHVGGYRSYFHDVWNNEKDATAYPAFLDFATSSALLSVVGNYLKCIPALSTTLPQGIRLVESNAKFDDHPDVLKDSQLYHIDYYSRPNIYVLVLCQDTTFENGPWTFLPRSVSQEARKKLGYWKKGGQDYRLSDETVYSVADRSQVIEFCYPRGTVLFIESTSCLHFGSRKSIDPRFQLMLGYTSACRTDFSEHFMKPEVYTIGNKDSRLRQLVLQKNLL